MSTLPISKGRGKKSSSGRFKGVNRENLQKECSLLDVAFSKSSQLNRRRAEAILEEFTSKTGFEDPVSVTSESSMMILNLLYEYCKAGKPHAFSDDSIGALVQGLRAVYSAHGHKGTWFVDVRSGTASGNPLIGNEEVKKLRANQRVHLSTIGKSKSRASPLTVAHVCEHAERYWFSEHVEYTKQDYKDVLLHAIMVVGLNLGMRYDEIQKVKIGNVTVHPGTMTTGSIVMTIDAKIKNSTIPRQYKVREWPGNTDLRKSILSCPFTALLSWMRLRGNRPGYLFWSVNNKNMMTWEVAWPIVEFTNFLRIRLRLCGVGEQNVRNYSGHSLKRGSVQLYRSLGLRDDQVMEIIQMTGENAYANYCATYNDCAPNELPRFNNIDDYLAHAESVKEERQLP